MIALWKVFALLLISKLIVCDIIEIEDGKIEGQQMTSRLGENFHAFLRIPFAEPPVGQLRFQAPMPNKKWEGIHNGTFYGPMCVQPMARPDLGVSEDCLQLNVFTRNISGLSPVIVFIHGGAFEVGTGIDQGGPHNLMDRDVVLVTINYRLGALGFLATGTKEAPGNAALKDQVLALKWIQKNIRNFGGNPEKVTVTGLSAGAFSATSFMVSPMARDLFHGVIAMSGSITLQKPLETNSLGLVKKLGKVLNCDSSNITEMINCFRQKDSLEFANAVLKDYPECELISWMPVIEPDFGQERFLIEDPIKSLEEGNFSLVPVMIGRTADEFADIVPVFLSSDRLQDFNDDFDDLAPYCFFYEKNSSRSRSISRSIKEAYLPLDKIDIRSFGALNLLFGDSYVGYPVHRLVHLISNVTDVYYYKFSYVGRFSIFKYPRSMPYGVNHVDDLQYVFYVDYITNFALIQATDPENFMIERMTAIWESFAHTGNPNFDADPNVINWPKHDSVQEYYMDIGIHLIEKNGLFLERYSIWDKALRSEASILRKLEILLTISILVSVKKLF